MPAADNTQNPNGEVQGEVVYLFAYDVAYEIRPLVPTLMGRPGRQFSMVPTRRMPKDPFFYLPQVFDLPNLAPAAGPQGPIATRGTVKLFHVGAISIAVHVPFKAQSLQELVAYHDLCLSTGPLPQAARAAAEAIFEELRPHCIQPVKKIKEDEAYTVFCVQTPLSHVAPAGAAAWLQANCRLVAAILTQEEDMDRLSIQEAAESTALSLSYYDTDLAVIDWNAALVMDEPEDFEETLHVIELANVQLMELGVVDQVLDEALGRAYRDLRKVPWDAAGEFHRNWRGRRDIQRDLGEIRMDLERLRDELFNTTKFFGDWHLARIYQHLSTRFHLVEWSRIIEGKLRTLNEFYQIIKNDQNNRLMVILEALIVLMFIIDLALLFIGLGK